MKVHSLEYEEMLRKWGFFRCIHGKIKDWCETCHPLLSFIEEAKLKEEAKKENEGGIG